MRREEGEALPTIIRMHEKKSKRGRDNLGEERSTSTALSCRLTRLNHMVIDYTQFSIKTKS